MLIDTSVIIDYLRTQSNKESTLFFQISSKYQSSVSMITHTELYSGKSVWESPQSIKALQLIFTVVSVIPITETISKNAGFIRASYGMGVADAIIASTAIATRQKLCTLNQKDFIKVPKLKLHDLN